METYTDTRFGLCLCTKTYAFSSFGEIEMRVNYNTDGVFPCFVLKIPKTK